MHIVSAYQQLFVVTAHFDSKTDCTRWGIYVLGSERYANKFQYEIDVKDAAKPMRGLSVGATCDVIPHDDAGTIKQNNYFHWPCSILEEHCGRNLAISVRIYRMYVNA